MSLPLTQEEENRRIVAYNRCLTIKEMAREVGVSHTTFQAWLKKQGIPVKRTRKLNRDGCNKLTLRNIFNSEKRTRQVQVFIAHRPEWERRRMRHFMEYLGRVKQNLGDQEVPPGAGARFLEQYLVEFGGLHDVMESG